MKRLFVIVLCGALTTVLAFGCEARMEVAKDKVKEKIDSLLGSMDVKRKEIEISVNGMKEGIRRIRIVNSPRAMIFQKNQMRPSRLHCAGETPAPQ